jgi:hypothetical protein
MKLFKISQSGKLNVNQTKIKSLPDLTKKLQLKCKLQEMDGKNLKDSLNQIKEVDASTIHQRVKLNPKNNILIRMKKFYQGLYVKFAKTLPSEQNTKKNTLKEMSKKLQKKALINGMSYEEVVLYLGSIIYPSKNFFANEKVLKTVDLEIEHTPKEKAKLLIFLFHD